MQYILLIYSNEGRDSEMAAGMTDAERQAWMGQWFQYTEAVKDSGCFVAGDAMQPTSTATTTRATIHQPSPSPSRATGRTSMRAAGG